MKRHYVFIFNLVQDVAILWPLIHFAKAQFSVPLTFFVTPGFHRRDPSGLWTREVQELASAIGAPVVKIATAADAALNLYGRTGSIFAGSESELSAHRECHEIFAVAPSAYLKITLQHGFECVGFMHNTAHDAKYGSRIRFGADIAVGWFQPDFLFSVVRDQRPKLFIAGPPQLLSPDQPTASVRRTSKDSPLHGIVCENLHSVRLQSDEAKSAFLDAFSGFAARAAAAGGKIDLRPHPHGRYTEKSAFSLPAAVSSNALPLYKQDLTRFHFGISAPSSVLLDLIFAGVPVAVWQDRWGSLDISNYSGLPVIVGESQWWDFATEAYRDPNPYLRGQMEFVRRLGFPDDAPARYAALLAATP